MPASVRIENEIAIITMDDGKANAINPPMLDALNAALDKAEAEAKAVVLAGREGRFSAGFDLRMIQGATQEEVTALMKAGGRLAMRLFAFPMPVIAACTGHGIAMGAFLLLGSDTRIGAKGAFKIGTNETAINLVMPTFGIELPKARLNPLRLTEAVINGTLFDPEQAVEVGFLDMTVEPHAVLDAAIAEAERLKPLTGPTYAANKTRLRRETIQIVTPTVAV